MRGLATALVALVLVLPAAGASAPGPSVLTKIHEVTADELPTTRTPAAALATWCGAATERDRTPNVVAGHAVHWLYVTPLNEPDRFSTLASVMQTDAEAIDAWWRREDATRTLRNDLTQLTCGAQLDLTSRRFQAPASQFFGDFGFGQIFGQLEGDGFDSPFTKYVVYYDGPVPSSELNVCGRGGGDDDGIGLAIVYVRACAGVSTAAVLAHEVLHTLGAVAGAAPNGCDGHVCGNPSDLMSPNIGGEPLEAKLLDAGRDDYYGHAGLFVDIQDAPWLVQLDRQRQLRRERHRAGPRRRGRPRPRVRRELHDDVEREHAPEPELRRPPRDRSSCAGAAHAARVAHARSRSAPGRRSAPSSRRGSSGSRWRSRDAVWSAPRRRSHAGRAAPPRFRRTSRCA